MSTSLLYYGVGVRDYRYVRTRYEGGAVVFVIEPKAESECCTACGSSDAWGHGQVVRPFPDAPRQRGLDLWENCRNLSSTACRSFALVIVLWGNPYASKFPAVEFQQDPLSQKRKRASPSFPQAFAAFCHPPPPPRRNEPRPKMSDLRARSVSSNRNDCRGPSGKNSKQSALGMSRTDSVAVPTTSTPLPRSISLTFCTSWPPPPGMNMWLCPLRTKGFSTFTISAGCVHRADTGGKSPKSSRMILAHSLLSRDASILIPVSPILDVPVPRGYSS